MQLPATQRACVFSGLGKTELVIITHALVIPRLDYYNIWPNPPGLLHCQNMFQQHSMLYGSYKARPIILRS